MLIRRDNGDIEEISEEDVKKLGDDIYDGYQKLAQAVLERALEDWIHPDDIKWLKDEGRPTHEEILQFIDSPYFELYCLVISQGINVEVERKNFRAKLESLEP